jgi:glycosyltransferase involved in cell wall biosynthesis
MLVFRLRTFILFPISFIIKSIIFENRYDKVIVCTDPFYLPFIVRYLYCNSKIIVLEDDLYPEALIVKRIIKKNGLFDKAIEKMNMNILKKVDSVVFISKGHYDLFVKKYGFMSKFLIIPTPSHLINPDMPLLSNNYKIIKILYSGTLGLMHDTSTFIKYLAKGNQFDGLNFIFRTSGAGKALFENIIFQKHKELLCKGIITLGDSLPVKEWEDLLRGSQVGIIFQSIGADEVIFPSKAASMLISGQAILLFGEKKGSLPSMIIDSDSGWVIPPNDIEILNRAILEIKNINILNRKRKNAYQLGVSQFSISEISKKWKDLINMRDPLSR